MSGYFLLEMLKGAKTRAKCRQSRVKLLLTVASIIWVLIWHLVGQWSKPCTQINTAVASFLDWFYSKSYLKWVSPDLERKWRHDKVQAYQTNVDTGAYKDFHVSGWIVIGEKKKFELVFLFLESQMYVPKTDITIWPQYNNVLYIISHSMQRAWVHIVYCFFSKRQGLFSILTRKDSAYVATLGTFRWNSLNFSEKSWCLHCHFFDRKAHLWEQFSRDAECCWRVLCFYHSTRCKLVVNGVVNTQLS